MLPPRIFAFSSSRELGPRIRPTPAVIDMSQPKSRRSTPSTLRRHLDDAVVGHAAAQVEEDGRRVPQGLDRPLPVAAAADVGADEHGLGIAPGQLGQVAAVGDVGLFRHE